MYTYFREKRKRCERAIKRILHVVNVLLSADEPQLLTHIEQKCQSAERTTARHTIALFWGAMILAGCMKFTRILCRAFPARHACRLGRRFNLLFSFLIMLNRTVSLYSAAPKNPPDVKPLYIRGIFRDHSGIHLSEKSEHFLKLNSTW